MDTTPTNDTRADSPHDYRPRRRRKGQFPPLQSGEVDGVATVLEDKEAYRSLLRSQGPQARYTLDMLQVILDYTTPYSELWKHGVVALQRLSVRTGLFPSMYELRGVKKLQQEAVSDGGYGEVYQGVYKGDKVCIKVLRVNQKKRKKVMKFYAREAILWGQLSHRNILPFYGVCTLDSKPCLVSPWAAGGNVVEYLEKNPDADRLALVRDVTEGLRYLHALDIVHGDLKGANVLIDLHGCAYLADFGLSSVHDKGILCWTTQSAPVSIGGTVRWLAPELLQDDAQNTKQSDMYAWGCTAYEIFTGEVPYAETSAPFSVYMQKMQGVLPAHASRIQARTDIGLDNSIWDLLHDYWNYQPENRPTIEDAQLQLQQGPAVLTSTKKTAQLPGHALSHPPAHLFFFDLR